MIVVNQSSLVAWQNNQFKTVTIPSSSGIQFNNNQLSLAAPIYASLNSKIGIGIEPTETLDVNTNHSIASTTPITVQCFMRSFC